MNTRFLGLVTIASSAILILDSFRHVLLGREEVFDTVGLLTSSLWCIGGIAALVGMVQLNALGKNTVVRALAFVPILGFGLLVVANIIQLAGMVTTENNSLAGVGWLVQMAGMVVVGILTIAAGIWRGWRRFVPLATIVSAPITFAISDAIGNFIPVVGVYVLWLLLGYVVATGEREPAGQPGLAS
jgi:hypothetical protein